MIVELVAKRLAVDVVFVRTLQHFSISGAVTKHLRVLVKRHVKMRKLQLDTQAFDAR